MTFDLRLETFIDEVKLVLLLRQEVRLLTFGLTAPKLLFEAILCVIRSLAVLHLIFTIVTVEDDILQFLLLLGRRLTDFVDFGLT